MPVSTPAIQRRTPPRRGTRAEAVAVAVQASVEPLAMYSSVAMVATKVRRALMTMAAAATRFCVRHRAERRVAPSSIVSRTRSHRATPTAKHTVARTASTSHASLITSARASPGTHTIVMKLPTVSRVCIVAPHLAGSCFVVRTHVTVGYSCVRATRSVRTERSARRTFAGDSRWRPVVRCPRSGRAMASAGPLHAHWRRKRLGLR
jgi:hypothetical protein